MTNTRTETDSFGPIEVPGDCYWGAQTQRSLGNFPFGERERMPIRLVHAQAIVKQAAARVNRKHGLDGKLADAMESAASAIIVPATLAMIHTPRTLSVAASAMTLTSPSVWRLVFARLLAIIGNLPTLTSPRALACSSVRPTPAISGKV